MEKLNEYTQEIIQLKQQVGGNAWMIGNRLNEIKKEKWYLELYPSWMDYLEKAVEISERSAELFMRISREVSQLVAKDWGVKKLDLLLRLEEPAWEKVMDEVGPRTGYSELKKSVERVKVQQEVAEVVAEQQDEISQDDQDFFWMVEQRLKALKTTVNYVDDCLEGCDKRVSFGIYPRQAQIMALKDEIKQIVSGW